MLDQRAEAARIISRVIDGKSLSDASFQEQAFMQALCYGVCRSYFRLEAILEMLLDKPINYNDQDIYALLLIGLYQLTDMRVPTHAAVGETVEAVKSLDKVWAKGLVNAVLRNYLRNTDSINERIQSDPVTRFSHPDWLVEKIMQQWPEDYEAILTANNAHPPFALRVNQQKMTREQYLEKAKWNDKVDVIAETQSGFILREPVGVTQLPGFRAGDISVQDGAAQLAAELLELAPGQRVLDACAAPGGKTAHILELQPDLAELIALDKDALRLNRIEENLLRLQLSATQLCADAGDIDTWWDGKPFDRILLDAPCSASGVIRRHPDIKLLRQASDSAAFVETQQRLLAALWQVLKPGGILLYATCSIFSEENVDIVRDFLSKHADAREEKIDATWGKACEIGRQILPGMHGMDGFYYARLRK